MRVKITLIILLVFLSGCTTFPATLNKPQTLSVRVIDKNTNTPVHRFKVRISKNYAYKFYWPVLSTAVLAEYVSNKEGYISAPISIKGDYTLEAFGEIGSDHYYGQLPYNTKQKANNEVTINVDKSNWRKKL